MRYIGRFLPDDPLDAPWPVVEHLATATDIDLTRRGRAPGRAARHRGPVGGEEAHRAAEDGVRARVGDPGRLRVPRVRRPGVVPAVPHVPAWTDAEGPKALFDHAVGWLRRNRVLLRGVSVLARQVSEVRKVAEKRLHATVAGAARRADPALPGDLAATLKTAGGLAVLGAGAAAPAADPRTTGTAFARAWSGWMRSARTDLEREAELVVRRASPGDQIAVDIVQEEEPLQLGRVGSSANFPYASACSSVRNSSRYERTVASPSTRPAIFPRIPAEPPASVLAEHDRSQRRALYRCSPKP